MSNDIKLTPDERWTGVYEIDTYEKYLGKVGSPILLMESVDKEVQGVFRLVNKLIALGYFEYELWDLACMRSLLAFELALKNRYRQLQPKGIPKGWKLIDLIKWFRINHYFETESEDYLDTIRIIRNHFAHPEYHSIGGPMISWHIHAAASLINDLYEDKQLRQERKQETAEINEKLKVLQSQGIVLYIQGKAPALVYRFITGFINNKKATKEYHFVYRPAFVLPEKYARGDSVMVYNAYAITCNNFQFDEAGGLTGIDAQGNPVFSLTPATGSVHSQWKMWLNEFQTYLSVLPHFELTDNRCINEVIGNIKWNFHY